MGMIENSIKLLFILFILTFSCKKNNFETMPDAYTNNNLFFRIKYDPNIDHIIYREFKINRKDTLFVCNKIINVNSNEVYTNKKEISFQIRNINFHNSIDILLISRMNLKEKHTYTNIIPKLIRFNCSEDGYAEGYQLFITEYNYNSKKYLGDYRELKIDHHFFLR